MDGSNKAFWLIGVAALALHAQGCSFTQTEMTACASTSDCRSAFGLGFVCSESGFCEGTEALGRCDKTYPVDLFADAIDQSGRLVMGTLMDRSSIAHVARENAAELAVRQINEAGGIDGEQLGIIFCSIEENANFDRLGREEAAIASALYLADIGVPAIVGPVSSNDTKAVFESLKAENKNVVLISPSATSTQLTDLEPAPTDAQPGLLWRTVASDELQGKAIAYDMTTGRGGDPVESVALVYELGAYGESLAAAFSSAFAGTTADYPFEGSRYAQHLAAIAQTDIPEVLFISSQEAEISRFLNAAVGAGLDDRNIFLTDGAAADSVFVNGDPQIYPQVRGTVHASSNEEDQTYLAFKAAFQGFFRYDPASQNFVPHSYDAAWMAGVGMAYARAKNLPLTGTSIATGMRHVNSGDPFVVGSSLTTARDIFAMGQDINIVGASGALDYDLATEETTSNILVWTVGQEEGKFTIVPEYIFTGNE